jgi:hypothetical protein
MANFDGVAATTYLSERRRGIIPYSDKIDVFISAVEFTTEKAYGGLYSLKIRGGQTYTINVGCDAGSRTISFYVWPESADTKLRAEIFDPDTNEMLTSEVNAGYGEWEKVEINFTAEKKVYILRLANYSDRKNESKHVCIDNVEVA